jgi:hypothetical protein
MSPQLVMSPSDLGKIYRAASAIGNPIAIAGRFAGLGEAEQRAGVPAWAWIAVALGIGVVVGMQYGPKLKSYAPNRQFLRSVRYAR